MKKLITIIIMLVAAGCGTTEVENIHQIEIKVFTKEDVVGSYEKTYEGDTTKLVLLENGKVENYFNGEKIDEATLKIVGKEVHVGSEKERAVFKVELNGDLTCIAHIGDGRKDFATKDFKSFKKVK